MTLAELKTAFEEANHQGVSTLNSLLVLATCIDRKLDAASIALELNLSTQNVHNIARRLTTKKLLTRHYPPGPGICNARYTTSPSGEKISRKFANDSPLPTPSSSDIAIANSSKILSTPLK